MAAIDFVNPAPLMWDFEHQPERGVLAGRYAIEYTSPANCATLLSTGAADIGLVPVAAYATTPSLLVVPGCVIASLDHVRSIILVVREQQGIEAVRKVAIDLSSRSSSTYTRILFDLFWKVPAEFLPHAPDLEGMLAAADAAMLIGDPALLALEDRQARESRTGERLLYLDLAHEWKMATGQPWVAAFWAVRAHALEETGMTAQTLLHDLQSSRDHGLEHRDDLAREWAARIAVPEETLRRYLSQNIHYLLDDACLGGLQAFYRYAAECGALPPCGPLTLL